MMLLCDNPSQVEPIMALPKRLSGKLVQQQILNYYKVTTTCGVLQLLVMRQLEI